MRSNSRLRLLLLLPALVAGFRAPSAALTGTRLRHAVQGHRRRAPVVPCLGALRVAASATLDPDVFVKQSEVLATLSMVEDPSRGGSITSLGAVKDLNIDKDTGAVAFNLELGAPDLKGVVKKQSEETVSTLPWVTSVTVTMVAMEAQDETREASAASATGLSGVKSVVLCASCKGGVGKSTTAGVCVRDRVFKRLPHPPLPHIYLRDWWCICMCVHA
jgi:metal-sulfur cluster biosynthetic enzyme